MYSRRWQAALVLLALTAGPATFAHHSVPVNFDQSRTITVEGVLTEIKWLNPHSHFRLDVEDESGATVEWLVEMGSVNAMKRSCFPRDRFALGDSIAVTGPPGRRDRTVFLREVLLSDGTHMATGDAKCGPPPSDE